MDWPREIVALVGIVLGSAIVLAACACVCVKNFERTQQKQTKNLSYAPPKVSLPKRPEEPPPLPPVIDKATKNTKFTNFAYYSI